MPTEHCTVERTVTMARKGKKVERVVYEEKPQCGRCGAGIVGVVPRWYNEKPLCRECTFELEQMVLKGGIGKAELEETITPLSPEEIARRKTLIILLVVIGVILLFRIYTIAPMFQAPKPLRLGVKFTDSLTDRCIEQLWVLSRDLQEKKLPKILPGCPSSSEPYILKELEDDTIILCPTPEQHGLAELSVSLTLPIPNAIAGDGP